MASERVENIQEITMLFTFLVDTKSLESRKFILKRLLQLIPAGHHPVLYIEKVDDPHLRMLLREKYSRNLNELKLVYDVKRALKAGKGDIDLETGAFLLSRLGDRYSITPDEFASRLNAIAFPLRARLEQGSGDHGEKLETLRQYLFEELGFRGNTDNYYDPENSYLTRVLETRKGIPVSLSVLVLLIASRLDLPIRGVNLPGHFLLRYQADGFSAFLDPFNGGSLLSEEECLQFLTWQGLEPSPAYLTPSGSLAIVKRMYRNLINYYSSRGEVRMEKVLRHHFSLLHDVYTRS